MSARKSFRRGIFMQRFDNHRSHIKGYRRCIGNYYWREKFEIIAERQIKKLNSELSKQKEV